MRYKILYLEKIRKNRFKTYNRNKKDFTKYFKKNISAVLKSENVCKNCKSCKCGKENIVKPLNDIENGN